MIGRDHRSTRGDATTTGALRRRRRTPVWLSLLWRVGLVLALLGIALAGHWLDRAGLRDNIDGHISFADVLYFTMITVTTVGYGDIVPVTQQAGCSIRSWSRRSGSSCGSSSWEPPMTFSFDVCGTGGGCA